VNGRAQTFDSVAYCYAAGIGVVRDMKMAYEWYVRASGADVPLGHYNVGCFYEQGTVVEKSLSTATHYYSLAASQNLVEAVNAMKRLETAVNPVLYSFLLKDSEVLATAASAPPATSAPASKETEKEQRRGR